MAVLALAVDTMLGRLVGDRLATEPFDTVFATQVRAWTTGADLRAVNLECCISDRGSRWAAPGKPFSPGAPTRR